MTRSDKEETVEIITHLGIMMHLGKCDEFGNALGNGCFHDINVDVQSPSGDSPPTQRRWSASLT